LENILVLGPSLVVLFTWVLFIAALFVKRFTHDLLLESAVFLISVKLILLGYRNNKGVEAIQEKLDMILSEEKHLEKILSAIIKSRDNEPDSGAKKPSLID
jgi:hypothetical protein